MRPRRRDGRRLAVLAALSAAVSCRAEQGERGVSPASPRERALDEVPADASERTRAVFEGKLELAAFELEPRDRVLRGERIRLRRYWRCKAPLEAGWEVVTELLDARGRPLARGEEERAARDSRPEPVLSPSGWRPGQVYMDELELPVPKDAETPAVTIAVSVEQRIQSRGAAAPEQESAGSAEPSHEAQPALVETIHRLRLISGASVGQQRARIATLATDWRAGEADLDEGAAVPSGPQRKGAEP